MKVAIIGASGFVGLRLVERLHLSGLAEVVPIVHAYRSLAVLARFNLPWRVVDSTDAVQLAGALQGCDYVVHAALGDPAQIVRLAEALYPAAARAGVLRIVALSSAAVHGLRPAEGTDEATPPLYRQPSDYNTAKAAAERILGRARKSGQVELVQVRPGIIHGPRSRLVATVARQLLDDTAYLLDDGQGICNAVGIDNLVDAIWLALTQPEADREIFLVNDRERVTWREFYAAIAEAVGIDLDRVHHVSPPAFTKSASERLARFAAHATVMAAMPLVPARVKRLAKSAAAAWPAPRAVSGWTLPERAPPTPSEEMCQLQRCRWRYPTAKAERLLGYAPALTFREGMGRTASWLEFVALTARA
jgi:nucleoside-diphosphate-sugar epimerase